MDVANRNVLTNERFQLIGNAVILRAAVSSDGEWLATLESWSNAEANYRDTRLKFWRFNIIQSNYELNTDVLMPHEGGGVVSLAFQPGSVGLDWPCLVSLGRTDGKFKLWQLAGEGGDASLKRTFWTCQIAGDFRKMMPTAQSFSEDGSLLAIAFERTVTLWDPHDDIRCFRYLVCVSGRTFFATLDVITQSFRWMVNQLTGPINFLVSDSNSIYMAIVFGRKISRRQLSSLLQVVNAAAFVPRTSPFMKDVGRPK